jgi:DNA-binding cell septation regulator SpoVG
MSEKYKVTEVRLFINNNNETFLANGSFTLDDNLVIRCKVVKSQKGVFVSLPSSSYKAKDGQTKWINEVFIKDENLLNHVKNEVMKKYNELTNGQQEESNNSQQQEPNYSQPQEDDYPF